MKTSSIQKSVTKCGICERLTKDYLLYDIKYKGKKLKICSVCKNCIKRGSNFNKETKKWNLHSREYWLQYQKEYQKRYHRKPLANNY